MPPCKADPDPSSKNPQQRNQDAEKVSSSRMPYSNTVNSMFITFELFGLSFPASTRDSAVSVSLGSRPQFQRQRILNRGIEAPKGGNIPTMPFVNSVTSLSLTLTPTPKNPHRADQGAERISEIPSIPCVPPQCLAVLGRFREETWR